MPKFFKCKFCGWAPWDGSYEKLVNHIMVFHEKEYEKVLAYANQGEEFEKWRKECNIKGVLR